MPFRNVTREHPCQLCGKPRPESRRRIGHCMISTDGMIGLCPYTERGAFRDGGDAGFYHQLGSDPGNTYRVPPPPTKPSPPLPLPQLKKMAAEFFAYLDSGRARQYAGELGVSVLALRRLCCGWSPERQAYTFPMRNDRLEIVGIRTRHLNGDKRAIKGSRSGIFVASKPSLSGEVYVTEGPTDTAGMLSLGLETIGRPSCTGGRDYIRGIVKRYRYRLIIIMADNDGPGRAGAFRLKHDLRRIGHMLPAIVVTPPEKDIRAWIKAGATRRDVEALVEMRDG